MVVDLFRSERLVYRNVQKPSEDDIKGGKPDPFAGFFDRMMWDPTKINLSPALWTPYGHHSTAIRMREWATTNQLATVYICKPCSPDEPHAVLDPAWQVNMTAPPPLEQEARETAAEAKKRREDGQYLVPVGLIHLSGPREPHITFMHDRWGSISLMVAGAYQGKGYGGEAIRWITDWGFKVAGLHRIEIGAAGWNTGAIRLYQRIGFRHEGIKREAGFFMGKFRDVNMNAMLVQDFWELDWVKDKDLLDDGDEAVHRMLNCG